MRPDESLLDGLDAFALLDRESERVYAHFAGSPDWDRPSRCEGWTTRDLLGHLTGLEDYVRANLDGRVRALFAEGKAAGARGVGGFNQWQVRQYADVPGAELVERWHAANLENRAGLRARGRDGVVDTSVGDYPAWLQTLHFAVEYATHGDDVGVHVDPADVRERTAWRVAFGRFVLQELQKPVEVEPRSDGSLRVSDDGEVVLGPEEFVEATQARLPADHPLEKRWRSLLATVP